MLVITGPCTGLDKVVSVVVSGGTLVDKKYGGMDDPDKLLIPL